jgi:plastocyanin
MLKWLAVVVFGVALAPALAGELMVALTTAAGQPIRDAVVMFRPDAGIPADAPRLPSAARTIQTDVRFDPMVLLVPVGAEVAFPNKDKVRHHVYSFSPAKRFELKLYGRDESRSVTFDKAGVVALGCNIHDQMIGFVVVSDTPYAAKVGPDGTVKIQGLPAGGGMLTVWQPFLRAKDNKTAQPVTVPVQGAARVNLVLNVRPPPVGKAAEL